MVLCEAEKKYKIDYPKSFRKLYESGAFPWLNRDESYVYRNFETLHKIINCFDYFVIPFSDIDKYISLISKRLERNEDCKHGFLKLNPRYKFVPFAKLCRDDDNNIYLFIYDKERNEKEPVIAIYHINEDVMYICAENFNAFASIRTKPEQVFFEHLVCADKINGYYEDNEKSEQLIIEGRNGTFSVNLDEIRFIEANNKSFCVFLENESKSCNKLLSFIEKLLPENMFFRCHKSFIISFRHITRRSGNEITFDNGAKVYISKNKIAQFKKLYSQYTKSI